MSNSFRFSPDEWEDGQPIRSRKGQKAAARQRRVEARKREVPEDETGQVSDDEMRRDMGH